MAIPSEIVIANRVGPPIGMASFPSVKTIHPEWVADQPDTARSQIVILGADKADVFVTIPDIIIRNIYWRWRLAPPPPVAERRLPLVGTLTARLVQPHNRWLIVIHPPPVR